jgi:hypothetical protein
MTRLQMQQAIDREVRAKLRTQLGLHDDDDDSNQGEEEDADNASPPPVQKTKKHAKTKVKAKPKMKAKHKQARDFAARAEEAGQVLAILTDPDAVARLRRGLRRMTRAEHFEELGERVTDLERHQDARASATRLIDRAGAEGGFHTTLTRPGQVFDKSRLEEMWLAEMGVGDEIELAAACAEARYRAQHRKPSSVVGRARIGSETKRLHDRVLHGGVVDGCVGIADLSGGGR